MTLSDILYLLSIIVGVVAIALFCFFEDRQKNLTESYEKVPAGTYLQYRGCFGDSILVRIRSCDFKDYGHGVIGYVTYDEGVHVLLHTEYWEIYTVSNNEVP